MESFFSHLLPRKERKRTRLRGLDHSDHRSRGESGSASARNVQKLRTVAGLLDLGLTVQVLSAGAAGLVSASTLGQGLTELRLSVDLLGLWLNVLGSSSARNLVQATARIRGEDLSASSLSGKGGSAGAAGLVDASAIHLDVGGDELRQAIAVDLSGTATRSTSVDLSGGHGLLLLGRGGGLLVAGIGQDGRA